jgi:hypothetical protein
MTASIAQEYIKTDDGLALARRATPARQYGSIGLVYVIATLLTSAHFMADTVDYVESVLKSVEFWEFGHLFWRPVGWLLYQVSEPFTRDIVGPDPVANVALVFVALNWIAGLTSALLIYGLLKRVTKHEWAARLSTLAFAFSHSFLNFAQTGSSYIPGLAFLLLGLFILSKNEERPDRLLRSAMAAGVALACSVCLWFLYIWAIPGALALPFLLFGAQPARRRLVFRAAVVFAVAAGLAYGAVLAHLGIYNLTELRSWISSSSHGMTHVKGVTRVAFGVPRSLIDMGNDGVVLKRFLLGDPFNPVSVPEVILLSLWALALFYICGGVVAFNLLRSKWGKRVLFYMLAGSLPMIAFAAFFDGAAIERYLPIYPFLFLALSCFLAGKRPALPAKIAVLSLIAVTSGSNVIRMSKPVLAREQERVAARIDELRPRLKPESVIVTIDLQDALINFRRSFPFDPLVQQTQARITSLVMIGTERVPAWTEEFAEEAASTWRRGGEVWVTARALSPRPREEWNWVEGADRRISWDDFYSFFSNLQTGESTGGEDGFVLLPPSSSNQKVLTALLAGDRP